MANFELWAGSGSPHPEKFVAKDSTRSTLMMVVGASNAEIVVLRNGKDLKVVPDRAGIVRVEPSSFSREDLRLFQVTPLNTGPCFVEAQSPSSGSALASLGILVEEVRGPSPLPTPKVQNVSGTPLTAFEVGFGEGLSTVETAKLIILRDRISGHPGQFYAGYIDGLVRGLWAGVKDLVDGLAALGSIVPYLGAALVPGVGAAILAWKLSDPEFRKKAAEQAEWAKAVAGAAQSAVVELAKPGSFDKLMGASKESGFQVGEIFAKEIDQRAALGGPIEYGQWAGWAVGRIAFEVILLIVTEGIGDAVKGASIGGKGLKGITAANDATGLFASVGPKIQEILERLPALRRFVETLTKTKSAATAFEVAAKAKAIAEAAEAAETAAKAAKAAFEIARTSGRGMAEAAEAATKAKEALEAAELATKAKTTEEATALAQKAKKASQDAIVASNKAQESAKMVSRGMNVAQETAGKGGIKAISGTRALDGSQKITIEGEVLQNMGTRMNFEKKLVSGSDVGLPAYQRLHLWGPRLGDEAAAGIWLGPGTAFNISEQATVETQLEQVAAKVRSNGGRFQLKITGVSYPPAEIPENLRAHEFLSDVTYEFVAKTPGKEPLAGRIEISVTKPPNGHADKRGLQLLDHMLKTY